jgi:hypothetical protein
MHLTRTQRKFILLYARLMELYRSHEPVRGGHIELYGPPKAFVWRDSKGREREIVQLDYLKEHRTAAVPRRPHPDEFDARRVPLDTLDEIIPDLFSNMPRGSAPVSNDRQGVFSFAENIGLSRGRARYIIDQEYARQVPSYSFATQSAADADRFTAAHGGLYLLYRHDINSVTYKTGNAQGLLARGALSIRYPVPYNARDSLGKGLRRVRCKLNLPSYNDERPAPIYKYDGYVVRRGERWCWLLQARPVRDESGFSDLILMYTNLPDGNTHAPIEGVMLTQNQEDDLVPTISKVVLCRIPGVRVETVHTHKEIVRDVGQTDLPRYLESYQAMTPFDERKFMRTTPATINLADGASWNKKADGIEWDYKDKDAIELLFQGGAPLNSAGLHDR